MSEIRRIPRTSRLTVPLRPAELALIESEALAADMPAGTWGRDVLLKEVKARQLRRLRSEGRGETSSYSRGPVQPHQPVVAAAPDVQERIREIIASEKESL
jgi:hypothetical protein